MESGLHRSDSGAGTGWHIQGVAVRSRHCACYKGAEGVRTLAPARYRAVAPLACNRRSFDWGSPHAWLEGEPLRFFLQAPASPIAVLPQSHNIGKLWGSASDMGLCLRLHRASHSPLRSPLCSSGSSLSCVNNGVRSWIIDHLHRQVARSRRLHSAASRGHCRIVEPVCPCVAGR